MMKYALWVLDGEDVIANHVCTIGTFDTVAAAITEGNVTAWEYVYWGYLVALAGYDAAASLADIKEPKTVMVFR